jgi:hypothetical protein
LLDVYELLYDSATPAEQLPLDQANVRRLQHALAQMGEYGGEIDGTITPALLDAVQVVARRENLRRRLALPLAWLDQRALAYLEGRARQTTQ